MFVEYREQSYLNFRMNPLIGLFGSISLAVLTSVGARLVIPLSFTPVPITMQTFFVLASGLVLGKRNGALSQIFYLVFAGFGLLQFAGGRTGFDVLIGVTAGYLYGFIFASYLIGWLTENVETRKPQSILYTGLVATLVVYIFGVVGLIVVAKISLYRALELGVFPFLPGDILKILLLVIVSPLFLPSTQMEIDTPREKTFMLLKSVIFVTNFLLYSLFVVYLSSNEALPPEHLPMISILLATYSGLSIWILRKSKSRHQEIIQWPSA